MSFSVSGELYDVRPQVYYIRFGLAYLAKLEEAVYKRFKRAPPEAWERAAKEIT